MSGRKSRTKGKSGELELVRLAIECGFATARRGAPMQAARGDALPDVDGIPMLWSEAKRYRRTPIARLARELLATERPGVTSVLFSRDDGRGERWLATLDARELLNRHRELLDLRQEVLLLQVQKAGLKAELKRLTPCGATDPMRGLRQQEAQLIFQGGQTPERAGR